MESVAAASDPHNAVNEHNETSPLLQTGDDFTNNVYNESKEEEFQMKTKSEVCVIDGGSSDKISYMEHGSTNGIIVFYFGCCNFNSKSCFDTTGVLNRLNVRLVNVDRPGYGKSTINKNYNDTPLLFAKNSFKYVLQHFSGHDDENENAKYFFIGYQTGCIYTLSIAYLYPSTVDAMSLICPPTPYYNGPNNLSHSYSIKKCGYSYCLSCIFCCYYKPKIKDNFNSYQDYLQFCQQQAMDGNSEDFKYIKKNKRFLETKWKLLYENNNGNVDIVWNEWFKLKAQNWGFPIQAIKANIHLWYGTKDVMSPYSSWYLNVLPNVIQHRCDAYGHLLIYPKFDQIIASMIHFDL